MKSFQLKTKHRYLKLVKNVWSVNTKIALTYRETKKNHYNLVWKLGSILISSGSGCGLTMIII